MQNTRKTTDTQYCRRLLLRKLHAAIQRRVQSKTRTCQQRFSSSCEHLLTVRWLCYVARKLVLRKKERKKLEIRKQSTTCKQWRSVGYRRPRRSAMLPPPKVVMLPFLSPSWAPPGVVRPSDSPRYVTTCKVANLSSQCIVG